ncbi:MAG: histidinol-phosphate transaminase [Candidatus Burarchaeum sp.]|nr:histidinol-phosphate transaminase [Candidatus Burarchaeum sp.]MDO8339185.1 histidinol-phosphate transaminase [Candidatus Burarchaeum sp.]
MVSWDAKKAARKDIVELAPYVCARDICKSADVFLDANESPYGDGGLNRYPDSDQLELRKELANYVGKGVELQNVLAGNGSDEIIDMAIRTFAGKGCNVLCAYPDYSMYAIAAAINGVEARQAELGKGFALRADKFLARADARTKIIFLSSPNSPTGREQPLAEIEKLAASTQALVFVDEAYFEFSGKSAASLIKKYKNILVSRTFSKAWGLAGIRLGYAVSSPEVISLLRKVKMPYNVSRLAERAALSALRFDKAKMRMNVRKMQRERQRLSDALSCLGFSVFPSSTNFLLCRCPTGTSAPRLQKRLMAQGVIIRDFSAKRRLENCVRITVGKPAENSRLLSAMRKLAGLQFDAVIFDMDGVLVDVRRSYQVAIRKTANELLGKDAIRASDVASIKSNPWFNDDFDATFRLVTLARECRLSAAKCATRVSARERNSKEYARAVEKFQSLYLGRRFTGLIRNEKPLISLATLEKLRSAGLALGIATGRSRAEALFAIRKNGWSEYFSAVVCAEDRGRKKPFPDSLLLAKKLLGAKNPIYVGDSPADALAARNAGMPSAMICDLSGDFALAKTDAIVGVVIG